MTVSAALIPIAKAAQISVQPFKFDIMYRSCILC